MVLEATMLVLDNSEWMRNCDYLPSRLEAQNDAVTLLFNAKTQSNPENTVGLMTMAGKTPEVQVTLTSDIGKILSALHRIKIAGNSNASTGIQVAQLALKHRQNKNQKQRIIVFVGSPLDLDEKALVKLGKKLKKNNVAVDIVSFGEESQNTGKLEAFIAAVNSNDNSHLVSVPPGPHVLSDVLISSPLLAGEDGGAGGFASGAGFEFGVDPSLDPELALALRVSMEEERARQEKAAAAAGTAAPSSSAMAVDGGAQSQEDKMLEQALAMSMGKQADGDVVMGDSNEDDDIARAIAMSLQGQSGNAGESSDLSSVIGNLPGVDKQDPRVQAAMKKDDGKPKKDSPKK